MGRTSVWLTGASFPTIFPTVLAFARITSSNSFVFLRLASIWASRSFFVATSSSAFSFACYASISPKLFCYYYEEYE